MAATMVGHEYREDDLPAIAKAPDGSLWVAWLSFVGDRDDVAIRHYQDGKWSNIHWVPNTSGDSWLPQIAVDKSNCPIVVWSQQVETSGNWDMYRGASIRPEAGVGQAGAADDQPAAGYQPARWRRTARARRRWCGRSFPREELQHLLQELRRREVVAGSAGNQSRRQRLGARGCPRQQGHRVDCVRQLQERQLRCVPVACIRRRFAGSRDSRWRRRRLFEAKATVAVDTSDRVWVAWEQGEANWGKDQGYILRTAAAGRAAGRLARAEDPLLPGRPMAGAREPASSPV